MVSLFSNLVDNLAERIHKIKCNDCSCFLEWESVNDNLIVYKCLSFDKKYLNKIDEKLRKGFKGTFKFSHKDINNLFCSCEKVFILMST